MADHRDEIVFVVAREGIAEASASEPYKLSAHGKGTLAHVAPSLAPIHAFGSVGEFPTALETAALLRDRLAPTQRLLSLPLPNDADEDAVVRQFWSHWIPHMFRDARGRCRMTDPATRVCVITKPNHLRAILRSRSVHIEPDKDLVGLQLFQHGTPDQLLPLFDRPSLGQIWATDADDPPPTLALEDIDSHTAPPAIPVTVTPVQDGMGLVRVEYIGSPEDECGDDWLRVLTFADGTTLWKRSNGEVVNVRRPHKRTPPPALVRLEPSEIATNEHAAWVASVFEMVPNQLRAQEGLRDILQNMPPDRFSAPFLARSDGTILRIRNPTTGEIIRQPFEVQSKAFGDFYTNILTALQLCAIAPITLPDGTALNAPSSGLTLGSPELRDDELAVALIHVLNGIAGIELTEAPIVPRRIAPSDISLRTIATETIPILYVGESNAFAVPAPKGLYPSLDVAMPIFGELCEGIGAVRRPRSTLLRAVLAAGTRMRTAKDTMASLSAMFHDQFRTEFVPDGSDAATAWWGETMPIDPNRMFNWHKFKTTHEAPAPPTSSPSSQPPPRA